MVPNTYRNDTPSYRYTGNKNDNTNTYPFEERKDWNTYPNGSNNNTHANVAPSTRHNVLYSPRQYSTNTVPSNISVYSVNPDPPYLGIPKVSSSPCYKQYGQSSSQPIRTSSPNLFEDREFGGTMNDIKNRLYTSSSPSRLIRPDNTTSNQQQPEQQQQVFPLLEDLKNVSESEIRRNKKG